MKSTTKLSAYDRAVSLLTRREHSVKQLHTKLLQKGYSLDESDTAIAELCQQNLLSNIRYAECYVRARSQRGYGPIRLVLELQQAGIEQYIIDASLAEYSSDDWLAILKSLQQKRFDGEFSADQTERAKQVKFMQYRGFSYEQITDIAS